jgi:predicted AAA+ superfamily ATPase
MYIGLEDPENNSLLKYQGLYGFIKKRLCKDRFTYIFIDDIQLCADYEKAVEGLMVSRQVDLYVTVSGSRVFSRVPYVEIRMLPLSFAEYLLFTKARAASPSVPTAPLKPDRRLPRQKAQMEKFFQKEAFNEYLSFGGFPFTAVMGGDAALIRQYVEGIYNTVLVRDVARQAGINDIPLLETIARMMSRSAGRPLNSKKLSTAIGAKGRKISANTVETYMQALTSALVFYHIGRFDIKTGKYLKTLGKYYIADSGMGNLLLNEPSDTDGRLENIVCMELLRRGLQVYVGKYGNDEIDFVVFGQTVVRNAPAHGEPAGNEGGKTAYFQVAATVRDPAVLDRKLSPLRRINDNHPKYILTLDETPFRSNYSGIIQRNLIEWLLESGW